MNIFLKGFFFLALVCSTKCENHSTNGQTGAAGKKLRGMSATSSPCNQEMMVAYGLKGHNNSEDNVHPYCPSVKDNCCTVEDAEKSMLFWLTEGSRKLEAYYESYLYSLKYLLGFAQEVDKLANEMDKQEHPSKCRYAAQDFKKMNWNPQMVKEVYKSFVEALESMGGIRKGFFCVLCDVTTQNRMKDMWAITNAFYSDRIYFDKEFCTELVDNTIRASYYQSFYLKRYLENAVTLMSCKNGVQETPEYEVSYWTRKQVELCYQFKNKELFFFCENYCENFHLTKGSEILDGNVRQLVSFVSYFKSNKDESFFDSDNNFLTDYLGYTEEFILDNSEKPGEDLVFFRAATTQLELDKFVTDVLYTGGFNPFDMTENALYPLNLASVNKFTSALVFGFVTILIKWI